MLYRIYDIYLYDIRLKGKVDFIHLKMYIKSDKIQLFILSLN